MGTIVSRKRMDGTTGHTAQVLRKKDGKIVFRKAETFDRKPAARQWMNTLESSLDEAGGLERALATDPTFGTIIDKYLDETKRTIGRTKAQVLAKIKTYAIADLKASKVESTSIVTLLKDLHKTGMKPQTAANYLSHISPIFTIARPAWGYPLKPTALEDAFVVAHELGLIAKSQERDRRPTLKEIDMLMEYFGSGRRAGPRSIPMQKVIAFAIFSTRRQEEITIVRRSDHTPAAPPNHPEANIIVRDMKHPEDKKGNHVRVDLPAEAEAILASMPETHDEYFPFNSESISAAFTRACFILEINTKEMPDDERLHFHDLRHDGISRLFELGKTIPQAASVSGHRSWSSLKRYTHLRQVGDKYAGWKWLEVVTAPGREVTLEARHRPQTIGRRIKRRS